MKLNKEIIESLVDEEITEIRFRKAVRNEIQNLIEQDYHQQDAINAIQSLENALSDIRHTMNPDNGLLRKKLSKIDDIIREIESAFNL